MKRQGQGSELVAKATYALRLGRLAEARELSQRATGAAQRDPHLLKRLADIALVLHDLPIAAERLQEAIAAHPPPPPWRWRHTLGEIYTLQGRLDLALATFRAALVDSSAPVDTWRWLARVLRNAGDVSGAISALRNVQQLAPSEWEASSELGGALLDARSFDEAEAAFDEATSRGGYRPALVVNRARLAARRGRTADAILALEACLARDPEYLPAQGLLASLLRDEQRFDAAAVLLRRVVARAPDDTVAASGLARVLLEAGAAPEAASVAQALLRRKPGHAGALAVQSLAHLALADAESAERLLDYERFVLARALPAPAGFSDLETFNRELAAHAARHPTLLEAPIGHATAGGWHSGSLLIDPSRTVVAFKAALQEAVASYCRELRKQEGHPFVDSCPASAFFNLWCVVLPPGGHQVPHIHPEAWLSGVYYAQLPDEMRNSDGEEGWLSFGEPDRHFPRALEPRIFRVRPSEGLLVLFPSYFYHRTIPFQVAGKRISIAFDLVPND